MSWLEHAHTLAHRGESFVMVTITLVRGHAPRGVGSKMLVTQAGVHGSVGGGNLEQSATLKARAMLEATQQTPQTITLTLNPTGGRHGVQCCGGEVTLLFEPVTGQRPCVAIFGAGHVGWAVVQVLGLLPLELRLVDSRANELDPDRLPTTPTAKLALHHTPVPETAVADLPGGAHLLILTHDHAEDLAILETALRRADLGYIGLIGSAVKWQHFCGRLLEHGFTDEALARVTTPIGLPGVPGKSPAAIAIATAAQLLGVLELPEGAS